MSNTDVFRTIQKLLAEVAWPDLNRDTVLNVWLERTKHFAPGSISGNRWEWPRCEVRAQGDDLSEAAFTPAIQQRIRQILPRDLTGISFRVDLRAGGVVDDVFHEQTYSWTEVDDEDASKAFAHSALVALKSIAWPKAEDSTVLNFTVVGEAPTVGEASLECLWDSLSVDAQGDELVAAAGRGADLSERLTASLPAGVSVAEFRVQISANGEIEGEVFHTHLHRWHRG